MNEKQVIDLENVKIKLGWRHIISLVSIIVTIVGVAFGGFYSLKSDIRDIQSDIKDIKVEIAAIHKEIDGMHQEIASIKVIINKEQALRKMEYRDRFDSEHSPYKDSVLYYDFINDTLYFKAKRK